MMFPRVPPQYDPENTEARDRDIVLRWAEGQSLEAVSQRYHLTEDAIQVILESTKGKALRDEIRKRAIEYTIERFDSATPLSLERLVQLRDESGDEKIQRQAAVDILEYSSLKKKKDEDGNIGADLIRGIAKLAKEIAKEDTKEP